MAIEVRKRIPGPSTQWVITDLKELWEGWVHARAEPVRFMVKTQPEADVLIGYSLIFGAITVIVGSHELRPDIFADGPVMWLEIVNVSPLV